MAAPLSAVAAPPPDETEDLIRIYVVDLVSSSGDIPSIQLDASKAPSFTFPTSAPIASFTSAAAAHFNRPVSAARLLYLTTRLTPSAAAAEAERIAALPPIPSSLSTASKAAIRAHRTGLIWRPRTPLRPLAPIAEREPYHPSLRASASSAGSISSADPVNSASSAAVAAAASYDDPNAQPNDASIVGGRSGAALTWRSHGFTPAWASLERVEVWVAFKSAQASAEVLEAARKGREEVDRELAEKGETAATTNASTTAVGSESAAAASVTAATTSVMNDDDDDDDDDDEDEDAAEDGDVDALPSATSAAVEAAAAAALGGALSAVTSVEPPTASAGSHGIASGTGDVFAADGAAAFFADFGVFSAPNEGASSSQAPVNGATVPVGGAEQSLEERLAALALARQALNKADGQ